jgi:hypothetical protein
MRPLRGYITINWHKRCPAPRSRAAGPALNSPAHRVVRNTPSTCLPLVDSEEAAGELFDQVFAFQTESDLLQAAQ